MNIFRIAAAAVSVLTSVVSLYAQDDQLGISNLEALEQILKLREVP